MTHTIFKWISQINWQDLISTPFNSWNVLFSLFIMNFIHKNIFLQSFTFNHFVNFLLFVCLLIFKLILQKTINLQFFFSLFFVRWRMITLKINMMLFFINTQSNNLKKIYSLNWTLLKLKDIKYKNFLLKHNKQNIIKCIKDCTIIKYQTHLLLGVKTSHDPHMIIVRQK